VALPRPTRYAAWMWSWGQSSSDSSLSTEWVDLEVDTMPSAAVEQTPFTQAFSVDDILDVFDAAVTKSGEPPAS